MPDRTFRFFMTLEEYGETIWEVSRELGCMIVLADQEYEIASIVNSHRSTRNREAYLVFFVEAGVNPVSKMALGRDPDHQGGVLSRPPELVNENTLRIGDIAVRSHWWDEHGQYHENPVLLHMFDDVRKRFRKRLQNGIWVGSPARYTNNVWYSQGAQEWCAEGKLLVDLGAIPAHYALAEPPPNRS